MEQVDGKQETIVLRAQLPVILGLLVGALSINKFPSVAAPEN